MGNVHCCVLPSPHDRPPDRPEIYFPNGENGSFELPHISEREDHSTHKGTLFMHRSLSNPGGNGSTNKKSTSRFMSVNTDPRGFLDDITCTSGWRSATSNHHPLAPGRLTKKFSSTSTIFIDDSTVSQPNLKATLKCVSLAIYYHIKHREHNVRTLDILDEKLHPLTRDGVPPDYERIDPEHRQIYKFIKTLFHAAQLTAECAIITLVYLERLLTYAEIDIYPGNWKRILLAAILLSSKVWDDQAVWNVDYCQILKDITVEDMNELERSYLELLQFNINVPPSTYAKYYFDLRSLADTNNLIFPLEPLTKDRAMKLEAISSICDNRLWDIGHLGLKRSASLDGITMKRTSMAVLS